MKTSNQFSNNVSYPITFIMNAFLKSPMGILFHLMLIFQWIRQTNATALPTNGIVANYLSNCNALDSSGNNYHGTAVGNLVPAKDRFNRDNSACYFDGSTYIFGDCSQFPTGARTVELWFNPDRLTTPTGQGLILLSYGGGTECGSSFIFNLNNPDVAAALTIYDQEGHCAINRLVCVGAPNPVGAWQHWVVTTDTNGTFMYLNGELVAHLPFFIQNTYVAHKLFTIGVSVSPSGDAIFSDSNSGYYYGLLDDVKIYNRSLSSDEILELYSNQPPKLGNHNFSITEGTPFTVTPEMLSATDSPTQTDGLQFIIDNEKNGHFEFQNSPGTAITTFTQQQIKNAAVRFVPNSNKQAPTFNIKVSDGLLWTESMPANIVFNTLAPTGQPTSQPTGTPTTPTGQPSKTPSGQPSSIPSKKPSLRPSHQPIATPTGSPTNRPSRNPSGRPTHRPSQILRGALTFFPSTMPTPAPSNQPTDQLSLQIDTIINYYLIIIAALVGCIGGGGAASLFSYLCPKKQAAIQPAPIQKNDTAKNPSAPDQRLPSSTTILINNNFSNKPSLSDNPNGIFNQTPQPTAPIEVFADIHTQK